MVESIALSHVPALQDAALFSGGQCCHSRCNRHVPQTCHKRLNGYYSSSSTPINTQTARYTSIPYTDRRLKSSIRASLSKEDKVQRQDGRKPLDSQGLETVLGPPSALKWQTISLWGSGAILGPLLDGRHSYHDVLHYTDPTVIGLGSSFQLETCWWVPLLFGGAAVILGVGHPALDALILKPSGGDDFQLPYPEGNERTKPHQEQPATNLQNQGHKFLKGIRGRASSQRSSPPTIPKREPSGGYAPSWGFVLTGIALFALQYDLSGFLAEEATDSHLSWLAVNLALAGTAIAHWRIFEGTINGLFWAALTAVVGPLVEIGLIEGLHLYHYTHPDAFGIPFWIPWVYWCGGAAVGNLGRRIRASLTDPHQYC